MSPPPCLLILWLAVYHPRKGKKFRGGELNTAGYGEAVVSEVRVSVYDVWGREPGPPAASSRSLELVFKGLQKRAPGGLRARRRPILQQHLHRIRRLLNLGGSATDRRLWVFFLTAWQGAP